MTVTRDHRELLKAAVLKINELEARLAASGPGRRDPIAIIGIGCRFPGSVTTPDEFWQLLASGRDAITEIPESRWAADAFYDPRPGTPGKMYTRRAGFVEGVDQFDPHFFAIAPREAAGMDPQQRLLLETSWEALERAGLTANRLAGSNTGVFIGICGSDYSMLQVGTGNPAAIDTYFGSGVAHSIASGRLSYALGLQGPSISVDTACSSSALAIHLACLSLRAGECEAALAGGVNVILTPLGMITASQGRMLSPDGKCKTFDASADGYARAEGCAAIVLKRLADAERDGDNVLGVILGSAVNQDGRSNGLTAPNPQAQEAVIRAAIADAGIRAEDVGYIEAHGTGTSLGDPIEMKALASVFGRTHSKDAPLLVGSVKTNVGHLEAAAGIIGLIKVVLSLQHGAIPPHLHFETPNPYIPWDELPIDVPTSVTPWSARGSKRIAGLSSFGFSGTNAHLILAEATRPADSRAGAAAPGMHVLPLSAKTAGALLDVCHRTAAWLDAAAPDEAAACAGAACGRTHFGERLAITGKSVADLLTGVRAAAAGQSSATVIRGAVPDDQNRQVAFLFSGQGSQYHGMGRGLFEREPEFRKTMLAAAEILEGSLEVPLLDVLYGTAPEHNALIHLTAYAQPALFALEHAAARLFESWGVRPGAVAGHSVGEYAAACAAGIMSFEDALRLIAERGRLMQAEPAGGVMAAVFADVSTVSRAIDPWSATVTIAACNGPRNVVISGKGEHVAAVLRQLAEQRIESRALTVSHAFHSPLMDPVLDPFRAAASRVTYKAPTVDVVSNLTGDVATDATMCDAEYWSRHLRQPVQFERTMRTLRELGYRRFVEIGPSPTLCSMGARILDDESILWVSALRPQVDDVEQVRTSFAKLYASGLDVDWRGFVPVPTRASAAVLPTYPFQRKRYWVTLPVSVRQASEPGVHPLLGKPLRSPKLRDKVFHAEIACDQPGYLADHRIFDCVIVPAAAYLEMALAVATQVFGAGSHLVSDLAVQDPMIVPDVGTLSVQTIASIRTADLAEIEIFSQDPERSDVWRLHASAVINRAGSPDGSAWMPSEAVGSENSSIVDGVSYYARLEAAGVSYGPSFRAITEALRTDGAVCATLTIPPSVTAEAGNHGLHPAILDCCLQSLGLAFGASAADTVYLPMGVERFAMSGAPTERMVCHARLRGSGSGETVIGDLVLENESDGTPVARLGGVRFKRAKALRRPDADQAADLLYQIAWRTVAVDSGSLRDISDVQLVGHDDAFASGIASSLCGRGVSVARIRPVDAISQPAALRGHIAYIARPEDDSRSPADNAQAAAAELLALVQSLANAKDVRGLTIITRGGQSIAAEPANPAQAAVWGLARVVSNEYPSLACSSIDAETSTASAAMVVEALVTAFGEREIAVRGGALYVPRLTAVRAREQDALAAQACTLEIRTRGVLEGLELRPASPEMPGPGEVQLRVSATGLNFRDVLNAMGMYPGDAGPLGSECVGEVSAIGQGVTGISVGDRVMAVTTRGFSTFAVTRPELLSRVPAGMSDEEAASIPIAFLTAAYALDNLADIKAGERVLIHAAAGGVGLAAVQIARRAGAEIFATAGSPEKRAFLRDLGIRHVMDSRSTVFANEIHEITGGEGIDIVLNSLIGEAIEASLRTLRRGGRFIEIGKTELWDAGRVAETAPGVSYQVLYLGDECARVPGIIHSLLQDLVRAFATNDLRPLPCRVFPLEQVEDAFRFMAQARHIGKVVVSQRRRAAEIRGDATYLITGGTGGLGLKTAEWLADRGAGHVVLVSRHPADTATVSAIEQLRGTGTRVTVAQGDVASRDAVDRILAVIDADDLPLAGIVHAAGIVDDGMLAQQSAERMANVYAPKVHGAWHLHAATLGLPLDFFVLYSAGAALFGSPGQGPYAAANAFLDALAQLRSSRGLPATSINWGPWSEVGMAARVGTRDQDRWAAQGIRLISPQQGTSAVGRTLALGATRMAVLSIDWRKFLGQHSATSDVPLLRDVAQCVSRPSSPRSGAVPDIKTAMASADPLDRFDLLKAHVRDQVQRVLAVDADVITDTQGLMELGMDSLMSVELSNRLKSSLGRSLPTTLAFEHPTVAALTAHLADLLGSPARERAESGPLVAAGVGATEEGEL